jgi:three-Cys-motif partner protein
MKTPEYEEREQTEVKHFILKRYLSAFVPIVGDWAADIAYVDCLAGPWESTAPNLSDTSFATAVGVMADAQRTLAERGKHPLLRCLFIEKNRTAFARLDAYARSVTGMEAVAQNWDFTISVQEIVKFAHRTPKSFPFFFIDPKGWEQIAIPTIAPILRLKPGEVLITLMSSFIRRFIDDRSKRFDQVYGFDVQERIESVHGEEREELLVRLYVEAARRAGAFDYACTLPVMKAAHDDFQFHMVYLTRNRRGVEVFKETERAVIPFMHNTRAEAQSRRQLERTAQWSLLPAEETYKESRFTRFHERQLNLAKAVVVREIKEAKEVRYERLWDLAMQHAAVQEEDLRAWVSELRNAGSLSIDMAPRQRVPKKENLLRWLK